jgi:hypothetical protein
MGETSQADGLDGIESGDVLVAETSPQRFTGEVLRVEDDADPYDSYIPERRAVLKAVPPHRSSFRFYVERMRTGRVRVIKLESGGPTLNVSSVEVA